MLVALACIAAVAAVVWFCLAGGNRQSSQGGTLVRLNGMPVCGKSETEQSDKMPVYGNDAELQSQSPSDGDGKNGSPKPASEVAA